MKGSLLKTTALALILSIFSSPLLKATSSNKKSKEMPPSLRFSGETSFNMFGLSQDQTQTNLGKGGGPYFGINDSRFNLIVAGKTEKIGGLEYSALIGLSGNPANGNVQENRIKLKGEWGTAIGGNTRGVDDFMAFGAFSVMGGTGGFAGNFTDVLNISTGAIATTDLAGRPKDATKIIYVTPRFNGIQGGISFTPSTAQKGDQKLATIAPLEAKSAPFDHNQVALAVNYREVFMNGLQAKLSFTSLIGQTKPPVAFKNNYMPDYHNTNSYAMGGVLGYQNFELGAEFINNGKSQTPSNILVTNAAGTNDLVPLVGADSGKAGSIAVSYTMGPNKFSTGYYTSSRSLMANYSKAKTDIISVAADHKFAPGLSFSLEGNFVNMKTDDRAVVDQNAYKAAASSFGVSDKELSDGVGSNTAQIFILSTKLKF